MCLNPSLKDGQRLLTVQTADSLLGGKVCVCGGAGPWVGVTGAGRRASSCVRLRDIPALRAPVPQGTRAWESGPSCWEGPEESPSQGGWETRRSQAPAFLPTGLLLDWLPKAGGAAGSWRETLGGRGSGRRRRRGTRGHRWERREEPLFVRRGAPFGC